MILQIEVIDVSKPTITKTKTGKGEYSTIEVSYRKDGKIEGKKLFSFASPQIYNAAQSWKKGDVINLEIAKEEAKDGRSYWQWKHILNDSEVAVANTETKQTPASQERANVQLYIIKQSSLSNAVATLAVGSKAIKAEDVISLAEKYVDFVLGNIGPQEEPIVE